MLQLQKKMDIRREIVQTKIKTDQFMKIWSKLMTHTMKENYFVFHLTSEQKHKLLNMDVLTT